MKFQARHRWTASTKFPLTLACLHVGVWLRIRLHMLAEGHFGMFTSRSLMTFACTGWYKIEECWIDYHAFRVTRAHLTRTFCLLHQRFAWLFTKRATLVYQIHCWTVQQHQHMIQTVIRQPKPPSSGNRLLFGNHNCRLRWQEMMQCNWFQDFRFQGS